MDYPSRRGASRSALGVVLADDSPPVRAHLADLLTGVARVRIMAEAGDVPGLIETVDRLHPDVVVLDISMPGGSGIDALAHIRQHCPSTCVIMLTNHSDAPYRERCLAAGAHYFFDKAREFERVSDVLREMQQRL